MGGEEAVAAEDRRRREAPIRLRHQIGQQAGIPEEAALYVEVIEEEYRESGERDAADRECCDRRPPRRATDRQRGREARPSNRRIVTSGRGSRTPDNDMLRWTVRRIHAFVPSALTSKRRPGAAKHTSISGKLTVLLEA